MSIIQKRNIKRLKIGDRVKIYPDCYKHTFGQGKETEGVIVKYIKDDLPDWHDDHRSDCVSVEYKSSKGTNLYEDWSKLKLVKV